MFPHRNLIQRDDEERHLENRLLQTLAFLAAPPGEVLTRQQFFESVWCGRVVNEEALSRALKVKLLGEPDGTQDVGGATSTSAFQAYLLGIHCRNRGALKETVHRAQTALEQAVEACHHTLELDPHYPKPHYFAAMSPHWLGRDEEALQEIQQAPLAWMRHTAATAVLNRLGRKEEADAHFAALVELGKTENNCVQQADIHAQLGDTDQAIRCLEQALTLGDPGLSQLLIDALLDPLRNDPRFLALLRKVRLAE